MGFKNFQSRVVLISMLNVRLKERESANSKRQSKVDSWFTLVLISIFWLNGLWALLLLYSSIPAVTVQLWPWKKLQSQPVLTHCHSTVCHTEADRYHRGKNSAILFINTQKEILMWDLQICPHSHKHLWMCCGTVWWYQRQRAWFPVRQIKLCLLYSSAVFKHTHIHTYSKSERERKLTERQRHSTLTVMASVTTEQAHTTHHTASTILGKQVIISKSQSNTVLSGLWHGEYASAACFYSSSLCP